MADPGSYPQGATRRDQNGDGNVDSRAAPYPATGLLASLGAEIPLVAAPMAGGPSTPALVVAAAEAGGIGFLAAGYKTAEELAEQMAQVRRSTETFGVNLFTPNPVPVTEKKFAQYARALRPVAARYGIDLEEVRPRQDDDEWEAKTDLLSRDPVPVVTFTFGLPSAQVISRLRQAGSLTLQTVTNPDEARRAATLGVDGLIVQGHAAGGHSATLTPEIPVERVPLAVLLDRIRLAVGLPLWAAGGLATAAHVSAAFDAGAQAAVVGTVLLRCPESGASTTYKSALADPPSEETVLTNAFSGRPARALRNKFVEQFDPIAPLGYPAVHHLTSSIRRAAAAAGDVENLNIWAGTGFRHATDQPAARVLRNLALPLAEARSTSGGR